MKKKPLISLAAILAAASLLLSGCMPALLLKRSPGPEQPGRLVEALNIQREAVNFSQLEYVRPDLEEIDAQVTSALALVKESGREEELLERYRQLLREIANLDTMSTLASIRHDLDLTDEYYEQENLDLDEFYNKLDNRMNELTGAILDSAYGEAAREDWGQGFIDRYEINSKLNSPAIEALTKQEKELENEYTKRLTEEYTTTLNGEEVTMEDLDFTTEEGIYAYYDIYEKKNRALGELYRELVAVRVEIAGTLGYDSYTDYAYDCLGRDFTKEDAAAFSEKVKKTLAPLYSQLEDFYYEDIRQAKLRSSVDFQDGLPALQKALRSDYPEEMGEALDYMMQNQLFRFGADPNMMQAGYTTILSGWQAPFMFVNTSVYQAPDTLFHEFGHYYNFYLMDPILWNDNNSLDLAEIHSQALEVLMYDAYPELYGEDAELFEIDSLLSLMDSVLMGCAEDEFQQAVFENPDMSLEEMNLLHAQLYEEYYGYPLIYEWVDIHHHFESPFYYISYATSAISAMEVWELSVKNRAKALSTYDQITQYTLNSEYLNALKESGLKNPFTSNCVEEIAGALADLLPDELPQAA